MEDRTNKVNRFDTGLTTDVNDYHIKDTDISHLRNGSSEFGTNNRTNEPANKLCINAPYPIIGYIYLYEDNWAIFSTDNIRSEIGLFKEITCAYNKIPGNFDCLNLSQYNLITGVSKQNFDCTWSIYWSDGYRNSDRTLNLTNVPYIGIYEDQAGCQVFVPTPPLVLDCSKLRLNRFLKTPCLTAKKSASGGNLANGSYYATLAYTINGQKISNYFGLSNVVSLFSHENLAGAVEISITDLDKEFDEYELVFIAVVNQQVQAKRLGLYSTRQQTISVDFLDNTLPTIPLEFLTVKNPLMDSSASISELGDSMIRIAPRSKFDFNYQPFANQIVSRWVMCEYPQNYYKNGGRNPNFLGDEAYCFFVEWIYDDGETSASFHIPGRNSLPADLLPSGSFNGAAEQVWEATNTASTLTIGLNTPIDEGGFILAKGKMAFYQTDELYPVDKPAVWGNLCGKNIRHHKFPEIGLSGFNMYSDTSPNITGGVIRIMGVEFDNIKAPVDNAGQPIPGIVAYRILRGSREGHKTIVAEGILNSLLEYGTPDQPAGGHFYPNYPYNSRLADPFISEFATSTNIIGNIQNVSPNPSLPNLYSTFHSPDTNFRKPFLAAKELKVYGKVINPNVELKFVEPKKHPKHKLLRNVAFFFATLLGLAYTLAKVNRKTTTTIKGTKSLPHPQPTQDLWGVISGTGGTGPSVPNIAGLAQSGAADVAMIANLAAYVGADLAYNSAFGPILDALAGIPAAQITRLLAYTAANTAAGAVQITGAPLEVGLKDVQFEESLGEKLGSVLGVLSGIPILLQTWSQSFDESLALLQNFSQAQQYALQQNSHCFYNEFSKQVFRKEISDSAYLGSSFQQFDNKKINNLYRSSSVILKNNSPLPLVTDTTKKSIVDYNKPTETPAFGRAESFYAALKIKLRNQYGQIGDVKQIPIGCKQNTTNSVDGVFKTDVIFGGDTYVTRYTEKNTMFFFHDWLYDQPDGYEFNYLGVKMFPNPTFWIDSKKFDSGDFFQGIASSVTSFNNISAGTAFPTGFRALDTNNIGKGVFVVKEGYFYLTVSGVRDFYVASEINVGYRDWEEPTVKRHYDYQSYSELDTMFDIKPDIIKADNFYKYDYSLSIAKSFINLASWASVQPTYYDPLLAQTCYTQHPKRVIYSLPQTSTEQIRDSWRIFLVNNYRDFKSKITTVKSIGENGAIILFESDSPLQIQGSETLQTSAGTKLTIGDGEFLNHPVQSLTNADKEYQYGACQNLRSVVNTPMGLFWISQEQGKILTVAKGVLNIAMKDMQYWFTTYLPYEITKAFPTFELTDNAVTGVACQAIFDSQNDLIYFIKKDYKLKPGVVATYMGLNNFLANGLTFKLGDPLFFDDASWTVSYDVKTGQWVSYHDWHPDLLMPSKSTFYSIMDTGIWKHNDRCDLFCNYYGVDYPFEIEFITNTDLQVNTVGSLEYQLEVYKYDVNCYDRFLFLTENFDNAVVFNNEQVSGLLRLNLTPPNDPIAAINYPIYNLNSIDILYSKVENKYKFNQITDMTDDRGEVGFAQRMLWNTPANGYAKTLNPVNINYQKDPTQQKKIRHYQNSIFLRRKISGNKKFVLNFNVLKLQNSPR